MQFFTSDSGYQEHQEPLVTPSQPAVCKKHKGVCCGRLRRLFMKIVVILPTVLAATAYISYEKAKSYSRSVSDVCYGRYESALPSYLSCLAYRRWSSFASGCHNPSPQRL